jgi:hypothetical protein
MNDRIKQLALQAGGSHYPEVNSMQLEKFAELLIRECADIATMNQFQWDSAGGYVLKHFEVE